MKKFWIVLSVCWLWTCSGGGDKATGPEEPPIVVNLTSLTGQAQKGPFNNGTSINVAELSNTLSPTGRNFSSAITDNTGRFSVANVQLESPFVELRATGFYFNEVSNNISDAQLTLYALSDLTNKSSLNVNILTHLEKNRMQVLMSGDNPKTFAQAKLQAQEEVLAIFDYSRANMPPSELLDISQGGAANAKLLAISAILQGDQTVGQISELLANISTDLSADGTLDDVNLQSQLITNTQGLDFAEIRSNLSARFTALGITATIPDFETEINQFLKPPFVQNNVLSITEDSQINITLLGGDPEGETITYDIVDYTGNATLTLNGNIVNYIPNPHFNGIDFFTFKANDGTSDSNIGTVTLFVVAEDDDPNTIDVGVSTDEDTAVDITLTAEEYDGDSYSFEIIDQPSNGSVSLDGAIVTYTPNQDFNGEDTFTFEAIDNIGRSMNIATATITIDAVNDSPVITNQTASTDEDTVIDITLASTDVEGDSINYSIMSDVSNGSTSLSGSTVTYVPDTNWNGTDTFTFKANDGIADSNTSTVTITVNSVNDDPVTKNVIIQMGENKINGIYQPVNVPLDGTDVDGDNLTYSLVSDSNNGTVSITNGILTYTPNQDWNGTTTLFYKANDATTDSNISTLTITAVLEFAEKLMLHYAPSFNSTVQSSIDRKRNALNLNYAEMIEVFEQRQAAYYCGGLAIALEKVFNHYGLNSVIVDMQLVDKVTHVSVLVMYDGEHYVFDPTFGITLKDPLTDKFLSVEQAILLTLDEKEKTIHEVRMPQRKYLFESMEAFLQINESFAQISLPGDHTFYYESKDDYIVTTRSQFGLNVYLHSVAPYLRQAGIYSLGSYVSFYENIIY